MGAKFEISESVGDELLKKFGRRMRLVSEGDFKAMASALRTLAFMTGTRDSPDKAKGEEIPSEKVVIRGGKESGSGRRK